MNPLFFLPRRKRSNIQKHAILYTLHLVVCARVSVVSKMRGHVRKVSLWLCRVLAPPGSLSLAWMPSNRCCRPKGPTVQHGAPTLKAHIERSRRRVALPGAMKNYPMLQACTRRFLSTTERSIDTKFQTVWSRRKGRGYSSAADRENCHFLLQKSAGIGGAGAGGTCMPACCLCLSIYFTCACDYVLARAMQSKPFWIAA